MAGMDGNAFSASSGNPILEIMSKADALGRSFNETHKHTLPVVERLVDLLTMPSSADGDPEARAEAYLGQLRAALAHMEQSVGEMMGMLYHVDVFLAAPTQAGISAKDPKTALEHVSDSFHMYQSELLNKRESLADLTCEEISPSTFAEQWRNMEQVQAGQQQTMDDLADLLAGLG